MGIKLKKELGDSNKFFMAAGAKRRIYKVFRMVLRKKKDSNNVTV